jgi:hypothetical protein
MPIDPGFDQRPDQQVAESTRPDLAQHRAAHAQPRETRGQIARRATGARRIERRPVGACHRDEVDHQLAENGGIDATRRRLPRHRTRQADAFA